MEGNCFAISIGTGWRFRIPYVTRNYNTGLVGHYCVGAVSILVVEEFTL